MNGICNSRKIGLPSGAWGRGQKSLNFNNKDNFKDFHTKLVCVLIIKRYKTYLEVFCSAQVMPQGWDLGAQGLIFLNMVLWHIKLMEMMSRVECK